MPRIRPFVGLLYDPSRAGPFDVLTAPPYDVITDHDRERLHDASPFNVVRLIQGRDLPGDDGLENRFSRAAALIAEWRANGVLVPTPMPALFPYEFRFHEGGRERTLRGIVAQTDLEPFGDGVIPHERTMAGPVRDRLALLREVRANLSPVYAVYKGPSAVVRAFIDEAVVTPAAREVVDEDGTRHRLWVREDGAGDAVCEALGAEPLLIADGHHRYRVALEFKTEMNAAVGPGPWDRMMLLLVDARYEDPPVLPIHRALLAGQGQGGLDHAQAASSAPAVMRAERVRDLTEVLLSLRDDTLSVGIARIERGELIHRIAKLEGAPPTVQALHRQVLHGVGHRDLVFLPDAVAAEEMVRSGLAAAAFFLPPTHVDAVRAVIAQGGTLPEKSTYFWPKPRTGMVIRPFDL